MIQCTASGLVYRNPKPHLRAIHAWHPSLVALGPEELLCSFDLGQAAESLDYRTYLARSGDGGATWSEPRPLFADPVRRPSTHTVRLSRLADGTLVGVGGRFYRDDPEEGLINRRTLGFAPMELFLLRSADGGATWSGPAPIAPPLCGPAFEVCHPILELEDGRWLLPTQTWRGWNGEAPDGMKAIALVSGDGGQSWPHYLDVFAAEGILFFEQSLVQLADGRLLAVAWAYEEGRGESRSNPYVIAAAGRPFSPPRSTGLLGETAKLLCLSDGRILCLYRRRDQPGLWASLSRIEGERWLHLESAPLWQGADSGLRGRMGAGDGLAGLRFGYPSMVGLPDGDVLATFWCCEDGVHNIRWLRLAVTS